MWSLYQIFEKKYCRLFNWRGILKYSSQQLRVICVTQQPICFFIEFCLCVCVLACFFFFFASIDSMITNPYHCPSNCPRELGRILWSVVFIIHTNTSGCQLWNEFDGYILWHFSLESKYIDCKFPLFLLMFIGEVFELHPFVCVCQISSLLFLIWHDLLCPLSCYPVISLYI